MTDGPNALALQRLRAALDEDRAHHAYLFEGPEGSGKSAAARALALYANCLAGERPCGACAACRQVTAGTHPDVIEVGCDPTKTTRVISVDQVHALTAQLQLQRHSARRRFVILAPADALNEPAANALLKTLEEPPRCTGFILVTARAAALLATVRSRCQRVRFHPASTALPSDDARDAVREEVLAAMGQPIAAVLAAGESLGTKDGGASRADLAVDAVEEILRDAVAAHHGRALVTGLDAARAARLGAVLWPGGIARLAQAVEAARGRLRLNVNGRVVVEALLAQVNSELRGVAP